MPFTGKATYGAGSDLPEIMEDVSDVIGIVSPHETPLLDHLGDPKRAATSTVHEWIEDTLLPNFDQLNQTVFDPNPPDETDLTVDNGSRFRVSDLVRPDGSNEVMFVLTVAGNNLTVIRGYGGTTKATLANDLKLHILGNAALEGADRPATRFTSRSRRRNYTQIFTASIEVSGSMQAARAYWIQDEVDYQKQERLRELLRDLENCVINGTAPVGVQEGSATVSRSMNGIIKSIATHRYVPGTGGIPAGDGGGNNGLTEAVLNAALRFIWDQSSGAVDTIVVNGFQKRKINAFLSSKRVYAPDDESYRDLVSVYESDFGVCRVVTSRWVPSDTALLLDSSRIDVMPLQGRSFAYKPLASGGDSAIGLVVGEYTLEFRNENAHGLIRGLATS